MTAPTLYAALALLVVALLFQLLKRRHNCLPWKHNWHRYPSMKICLNEGCDACKVKWRAGWRL